MTNWSTLCQPPSPLQVARAALTSNLLGMSAGRIDAILREVAAKESDSEEELFELQDIVAQVGMACYIKGALSVVFLLSLLYSDNFRVSSRQDDCLIYTTE